MRCIKKCDIIKQKKKFFNKKGKKITQYSTKGDIMNKNSLKETDAIHRVDNLQMNIYEIGNPVPYHWHDEYELIYVTRGECSFVVNGEKFDLHKGEMILIQGGELHITSPNEQSHYFAIVIHPHVFGSDCMHYFADNFCFKKVYRPNEPMEAKILLNIEEVCRVFKNKEYAYKLRIKSLMAEIFSIIFENNLYSKRIIKEADQTEVFEKIVEYVHINYQKDISLEDLCEYSNYSKSYIIRLFKTHTGQTPINYINSYRIYKAQELLKNTDKNIIETATECGYDNIGYFIKSFKRYIGTTPGKFRKSQSL